MSAWHPSSAVQEARDARITAINARLVAISEALLPSFLPAAHVMALTAERDALWLELADAGEFPCLVRKDGAARYARKAAP
jgi:hypothetical protein